MDSLVDGEKWMATVLEEHRSATISSILAEASNASADKPTANVDDKLMEHNLQRRFCDNASGLELPADQVQAA